ncbi:MAG: GNAT family N-acetyltransferase [Terriglobia bacterium]
MEIRPLHQFKGQELRNLFDQEREEWERQLYWDYREPQRVISAMIDAGSLPGFVALQEGGPVAYSFYVDVAHKGLLGGCFASKLAGESAERWLLKSSVAALQGNSTIHRIESQFINFREWPIAGFFAGKGFSHFDRCFMVRDCQIEYSPRQLVVAELKQLSFVDLDEMARLTLDTYASVIDREVTYHYQSLADCLEFLSNLMFRPGCGNFLPEASYSARDFGTNDLMGYVLTSRISPQDGHIPQIAVAPAHQGKGLGAELLGRAVRYLGLNGYQRVSLTVTESNLAALALYQRFGFSVHFRFPAFVWQRDGLPGG